MTRCLDDDGNELIYNAEHVIINIIFNTISTTLIDNSLTLTYYSLTHLITYLLLLIHSITHF